MKLCMNGHNSGRDNGMRDCKTKEYENSCKGIIFLDFDGVINNFSEWAVGEGRVKLKLGNASKSNIAPLNKMLQECYDSDIYVVISSAWNIKGTNRCMLELSHIVEENILDKVILGCTEYMTDEGLEYYAEKYNIAEEDIATRGVECLHFLKKYDIETRTVFVDDCYDFLPSQARDVVMTDDMIGLTFDLVEEIMEMFIG